MWRLLERWSCQLFWPATVSLALGSGGVYTALFAGKKIGRQCRASVHDIAVIGKDEHRERIPIGIADGGYAFPVLVTTAEGLEIILNEFHLPQTDAVFRPIVEVDWETLPTTFFPVDADSELWEFAEHAIPPVLQDMQNGARESWLMTSEGASSQDGRRCDLTIRVRSKGKSRK